MGEPETPKPKRKRSTQQQANDLAIDAAALRFKRTKTKLDADAAFADLAHLMGGHVYNLTTKFYTSSSDGNDVRQVCLMALLSAAKKYNPRKGHFGGLGFVAMQCACSTLVKRSFNKKATPVQGSCVLSADEARNDDGLTVGDLIEDKRRPASDRWERAEVCEKFLKRLWPKLSAFEQKIIAELGRSYRGGRQPNYARMAEVLDVDYKSIDNGLQRVRRKAEMMDRKEGLWDKLEDELGEK